jgi:hypothetical protein
MKTTNCHACGKIISKGYVLGSDIFCKKKCLYFFVKEDIEFKTVDNAVEDNDVLI